MTSRKTRTFDTTPLAQRSGEENQKISFQRNKLRCKELADNHAEFTKRHDKADRIKTPCFAPVSKNGKALPHHFAAAFAAFKELADNPYRFPSLVNAYGATINHNMRRRLAQMLCVLSLHMDCETGRVGIAKTDGMDTIKHRIMMQEYAQRFGEYMPESTWYRYIQLLQCAGLLKCTAINARVNQGKEGDRVRGVACYKQFTKKFFKELKVFFFKKFKASIQVANDKSRKNGLILEWLTFEQLKLKLNIFANHPSSIFAT